MIVGLGLLWLLSGTNTFILLAKNDIKTGAVSYLHVDAPVTVKSGQEIGIMIGLRDQTGQPLTDRTYGNGFGNFMIPPDGIKSAGGKTPVFNVDSTRTREVLDASGQKTGLYRVPVIISSWPEGEETGSYVVTARYFGGDYSTPDNSSHLSYSLTSSATFNAEVNGKPGFLRYADAEIDKAVLTVPATTPNEAPPPPKTNTVVFRVKMTAQEPTEADGRQIHGWAWPENIGKWAAPRAVDNTGQLMKASYGEIKEEEIDVKGKKIPTGVYDVPVDLVTSGEVAGRSAVVTIGVKEENFVLEMSSTVNFTSTGPEVRAPANPFFANQYLINPPHTPTIYELDFLSLVDPENWTNGAISNLLSGVADNSLTNINVTAAEYWIDSGTHYPMTASDGAFNSPWEWAEATVTPAIMLPLSDARHLTYVRAQETGGSWGATASTYLHLDRTAATVTTTRPPDAIYGLYVKGSSYQVLGSTNNPASSGDTTASPIESVQVYEESQLSWLDAINDISRGGSNFSFWSYYSSNQWNTAAVPNGSYNLRARVADTAGNVSGEFVVAVIVDNIEPTAALTVPAPGQGFNASPIAITGTANDTNFSSWLLEYGTGASPSTWATIALGTTAVNNTVFTNWDVSTLSDGAYSVRLTVTDRAGNVTLLTRVIYIDHIAPGSTISAPSANAWINGAINIAGVATDALSVDGDDVSIQRASNGYYWNGTVWQSGVAWLVATVTSGRGTPNANWSYAWTASGLNHNEAVTISSRARDSAGNLQNPPVSVTVKADTLAPAINWPASPVPQQWYMTNQTVTVSLNDGNPANGIGSRGFRWAWDTPPTDDPGTMNVTGDGPGSTVFPSEGKHTLYIRAYDNLGNMRLESREYWYDATSPGGWTGQAPTGWVNTKTPDITVKVSDATSGLNIAAGSPQYSYSINGGTSWSAWINATVSGASGSNALETITAAAVPFNQDSATQ
ncbi:MAG: Ig-like domain repeat protein, partial [Thermoleophilia bacterium]